MTKSRLRTAAVAALSCAALGAGTGLAIAHGGGGHPGDAQEDLSGYSAHVNVTVRDIQTREVIGMAMLRQHGDSVVGKIVVSGLEPGSVHANHLHGEAPGDTPKGCFADDGHSTRHITDNPDLVANSQGVAYARINTTVSERVIRRGTFWMIHMNPTPDDGQMAMDTAQSHGTNPAIACAPIR